MDRRHVGGIWIAGIILAVAVYAIGPDHFVTSALFCLNQSLILLDEAVRRLATMGFDAIRAGAIALFVVFWALALLAWRQGHNTRRSLLIVSVLFALLVESAQPGGTLAWIAAFVLVAVGALSMTRRVMSRGPVYRG